MNKRTSIVNISGDYEETMERLALHLGKYKNSIRRQVFDAIYGRGSKPKSKKQLADSLGKTGAQAQVVQDALEYLSNHNLIERIENKGLVADGSRWVYAKEEHVRANREKIVRLANNPQRTRRLATKRRPQGSINAAVSFVKTNRAPRARKAKSRSGEPKAELRIAFLVSNPDDEDKLRTDIELKAVNRAIQAAGNREKVSLRPYPAASFTDLLDALNEFKPQVVHFSGHGGGGGLYFDLEYEFDYEGADLDFETIAKVIDALDQPPLLLVFNACDTEAGASKLLAKVKGIVAMSDGIGDEFALLFAPRFYAALVSGQSAVSAIAQAKAVLEAAGLSDAELPKLLLAAEVDGRKLKLI